MADRSLPSNAANRVKSIGAPCIEEVSVDAYSGTDPFYSDIIDTMYVSDALLMVENGLDQDVTIAVEKSYYTDDTGFDAHTFEVSNGWTVAAGDNDVLEVSGAWPFLRLKFTPALAPTRGEITLRVACTPLR